MAAVSVLAGVVVVLQGSAPAEGKRPVTVEIKRSRVPGSATVRIRNALSTPHFSTKNLRSGSWISFRQSDLSVRVPKGLADRIAAAAGSGELRVTAGVGDSEHGLFRLTAGKGKDRVVLQRTRFDIGSEALQVQLGDSSRPFWMARASVKKNVAPGKILGASGVSRSGAVSLLDPLTLNTDTRPAKVGELRWFAKPAREGTLLRPFLPPKQWKKASRPAKLATDKPHGGARSSAPEAGKRVRRARVAETGPGDPGRMTPASFDPAALLAQKGLDPSKLKLVPSLDRSSSGMGIYYAGEPIGYYARDAMHRSIQLDARFHGKGVGTVAYLVMAKLFHDAGRGLLTSDLSKEGDGGGNLSPQARSAWRRFVDGGYAEARRQGPYTVYSMKQSAIDSVSWHRFTAFLADRPPARP